MCIVIVFCVFTVIVLCVFIVNKKQKLSELFLDIAPKQITTIRHLFELPNLLTTHKQIITTQHLFELPNLLTIHKHCLPFVARNLSKSLYFNKANTWRNTKPFCPIRTCVLKEHVLYGRHETTLKEVTTNTPLTKATNFDNIQSLER